MTRVMIGLFVVTATVASVSLGLSLWPGMLDADGSPCLCISVPVLGCSFLVGLLAGRCSFAIYPHWTNSQRLLISTAGVIVVTTGLLLTRLPQRLAFVVHWPDFQQMADDIPQEFGTRDLDRRIGIYHVDQYAADARGGVYFRTLSAPDGIGPDEMSWGFAYQPNMKGTPFGRTRVQHRHLFGDWYTFSGSDD